MPNPRATVSAALALAALLALLCALLLVRLSGNPEAPDGPPRLPARSVAESVLPDDADPPSGAGGRFTIDRGARNLVRDESPRGRLVVELLAADSTPVPGCAVSLVHFRSKTPRGDEDATSAAAAHDSHAAPARRVGRHIRSGRLDWPGVYFGKQAPTFTLDSPRMGPLARHGSKGIQLGPTAADGIVRRTVPQGIYLICIRDDQWAAASEAGSRVVEVSGEEVSATIQVRPKSDLLVQGICVDESGGPLAGMWVQPFEVLNDDERPLPLVTTDVNGRFQFQALAAGMLRLVAIFPRGLGGNYPLELEGEHADGRVFADREEFVRVPQTGALTLRVAEAEVVAIEITAESELSWLVVRGLIYQKPQVVFARGPAWWMSDRARGERRCTIRLPLSEMGDGWIVSSTGFAPVAVAAATPGRTKIRLSRGRSIAGRVLPAKVGDVIECRQVFSCATGSGLLAVGWARVGPSGEWLLRNVPDGEVALALRRASGASQEFDAVPPGDQDISGLSLNAGNR